MVKNKADTSAKTPRVIKVSTVITSVVVLLALLASFIGGVVYANTYNSTVKAQAVEMSKEFKSKDQK